MTEMTLQDAIAEVQLRSVNGQYWPGVHGSADVAEALLNAVASGDLIPKADAEMAVALAYQRAADEIRGSNLGLTVGDVADDVLALAPADALAEVQELRSLLNYATDVADRDHARAEAAEAAVARLRDVLDSIDVYLSDTLSGRVTPDPANYAEWLVDGIRVARTRARDRAWKPAHDDRAALTTPEKDATK